MFFRPGGFGDRINVQYDEIFCDAIDGATGWLPCNRGDWCAVNVARASINFQSAASSMVTKEVTAPEVQVLLELKSIGGQKHAEAWPIDQWQNVVVATGVRIHRAGFVRLRILNINNTDGTGVAMALQVTRTADTGANA
jgi:hypothetical protein